MPGRYDTIAFTPPAGVAAAAQRGLDLRAEHGRGGTAVGVARARDLAARRTLSPSTIRRMVSYFARHAVDKRGAGWASRTAPSAGYIAWLLWGGEPGRRWANSVSARMERVDARRAASAAGAGASRTSARAAKQPARTRATTASKKIAKKTAAKRASTRASR